jgi:RNA-directed DNA polymerase
VTNAQIHVGQNWVLRVDLKDFFPSINFGRVRGRFLRPPFQFPPAIATLVAHMCCHNNQLPQGAPTSPLVSNLICRRLDKELAAFAREHRCYYTRYCDDLTFSTSRRNFPTVVASVVPDSTDALVSDELRSLISANGFRVNDEKTYLRHYSQRQIVTGLVTNRVVNVPRNMVRGLQTLLYIWQRYGEPAAADSLTRYRQKNRPPGKPTPEFRMVVRGKIQYVGAIKGWNHPVYKSLAAELQLLDPSFAPTPASSTPLAPTSFIVFAEGKTDHSHMEVALKELQSTGRFLELAFAHNKSKSGDDQALKTCGALATVYQAKPIVFVFDRDRDDIVRQVTVPGKPFKDWGHNVFSIALPIPPHRAMSTHICIEHLYEDALLQSRDGNSRRVYLRTEFDSSGAHNIEPVFCPNMKASLVPDEVFDSATKSKVSLSKKAFAEAITKQLPPYSAPNFEGFAPLFDVFLEVRKVWLASP